MPPLRSIIAIISLSRSATTTCNQSSIFLQFSGFSSICLSSFVPHERFVNYDFSYNLLDLQKSCRDTSRLCKIYRRRGYCTKKSNVMARRCKATCGFCDRAPMKCKVKKEKENNCRKVSQRPKEGASKYIMR